MHGALGVLISAQMGMVLISAVIVVVASPPATPPPSPPPAAVTVAKAAESEHREIRRLSLPEALAISLNTSRISAVLMRCEGEDVLVKGWPRVDGDERDGTSPIEIIQVDPDLDSLQFKTEVMAHLRSVEQQYWSLAQQHAQLKASEQAVQTAENVVKLEEADLGGRNQLADVIEARLRLDQFRHDLAAKTADVATAERQLRNVMGRLDDRRRIVPISAPVEEQREPDWDECLATMMARRPDISRQREVILSAEMKTMDAMDHELLAVDLGSPASCREAARETQDALDAEQRQRGFLRQVVHQTTHTLARFFMETDANYEQLRAATRLREASLKKLDAQRASYEQGRTTAESYLDAVRQYASTLAQESQFKTSYNIALVALEEAKGTLLSARDIAVVEAKIVLPDGRVFDSRQPRNASGGEIREN